MTLIRVIILVSDQINIQQKSNSFIQSFYFLQFFDCRIALYKTALTLSLLLFCLIEFFKLGLHTYVLSISKNKLLLL